MFQLQRNARVVELYGYIRKGAPGGGLQTRAETQLIPMSPVQVATKLSGENTFRNLPPFLQRLTGQVTHQTNPSKSDRSHVVL